MRLLHPGMVNVMLTIKDAENETYSRHFYTDRTIFEMCETVQNISGEKLAQFACMLKKMGVTLIELNSKAILKHVDIPMQWVIFRVENNEDIDICLKYDINYVIFDYEHAQQLKDIQKLSRIGVSITIDIEAEAFKNKGFLDTMEKQDFHGADTVRISGITDFENNDWISVIKRIQRHDIQIDICPFDTYFTGTALAFDYINCGISYITASFGGYGRNSFVPVEELMVSEYLLGDGEYQYDLSLLPEMAKCYSEITGIVIEGNKPVIGSDIFTVESGIHTHGIDKCAITYEPFAPELVGQKRRVMVGKHSGRKSIERKLDEMGMDSSEYDLAVLLEAVREESINKGRALKDAEIKTLLSRGKLVCR